MIIKKKGQIVPKYLVASVEKKAQHVIKFGCDVEIKGRKITAKSDGYIIYIPNVTHVLKKKRQITFKGAVVDNLTLMGHIGNIRTCVNK